MESFEHLRRADTTLLTSRRRNGQQVATPVNMAVDEAGLGYFRTSATSGKAQRLANFPGVRIAPCTLSGRPQGSDQPALTELLSGADISHARSALATRYPIIHGRIMPLLDRLRHYQPVYYRLTPADEPTPWHG